MKKINAIYVSLVALVVAIVALVMCICCCGKGSDVEKVLAEKPELIVEAMQNYEVQQREKAMKEAQELLANSADELYNNAADGVLGNPEGKVVLVEFFDYSCGYCRKIYPVLKNIVAKNPDLKLVTKPLAFLSPMSQYAAKASIAAKEQGKFAEVYSAIFEIDGPMTEAKIDEAAVLAGANLEKLKTDMESEKVNKVLSDASELANKVRVGGVPTLVLNGKIIQTLDENVLQDAINAAK
ncbi:MAG: DsbA family protein [Alphaproteobacteria bacterium]|jgi:protein-disulfide isomerase|nr:DsbA family protein [Alphaproteobacteria bacterium]